MSTRKPTTDGAYRSTMSQPTQLRDVRTRNLSLVMRTLLDHGPLARAELAQRTGITSGAVTKLVAVLSETGLVREVSGEATSEGAGRPRVPLQIDSSRFRVVGLHIGYVGTTLSLLDLAGHDLRKDHIAHTGLSEEEVISSAVHGVRRLLEDDSGTALAVGASTHGHFVEASGVLEEHPFLDWHNFPLRETLSRDLQLPVAVDSSVRALARAERWFGAARGMKDFVELFVGNVLTATMVMDGHVMDGATGHIGMLEHFPTSQEGTVQCRCGRYDCLQTMATDESLVQVAQTRRILPPDQGIHTLLNMARAPRSEARALMHNRAELVGESAAVLLDLLDPECIVLAGGGLLVTPGTLAKVRAGAARRMGQRPQPLRLRKRIRQTSFGPPAVSISAGAIALDALYRDPLRFHATTSRREPQLRRQEQDLQRLDIGSVPLRGSESPVMRLRGSDRAMGGDQQR